MKVNPVTGKPSSAPGAIDEAFRLTQTAVNDNNKVIGEGEAEIENEEAPMPEMGGLY